VTHTALFLLVSMAALSGCAPRRTVDGVGSSAARLPDPPPQAAPAARALRPFAPSRDGASVVAGVSYGPYREGQRPGGPDPTAGQIGEDLNLIAAHWDMIRIYSSRGPAEAALRAIRDADLPLGVVLGAWIAPDTDPGAAEANAVEVAEAIRLARTYPDQVWAVSVGNETQVAWSAHRSDRDALIGYLRAVRGSIAQPVTTADDYNFWNKPESHAVAAEVDFVMLHAYAMWNQQPLDQAVAWTARTVASIQAEHPGLPVVLGETGWATALNPDGDEVAHIHAPAGEAEQARFYQAFTTWAEGEGQPYFYFEAFDEPWKGSDDPREVEKHWGLFTVERRAKAALEGGAP